MAFCFVCQQGFDRPHDCDDGGKCPRCGQPGNTKPRGWVPTEKEWLMDQPGTMSYCYKCERYFNAHHEPDGALRCPHCGLSGDDLIEEQNKKREEKFTYQLGDRVITSKGPGVVCMRHRGDVAGTMPWVGEEVRVKLDGGGYTYWTPVNNVVTVQVEERSKFAIFEEADVGNVVPLVRVPRSQVGADGKFVITEEWFTCGIIVSETLDGKDYDCAYEYAGEITCEECIVNGGRYDPRRSRELQEENEMKPEIATRISLRKEPEGHYTVFIDGNFAVGVVHADVAGVTSSLQAMIVNASEVMAATLVEQLMTETQGAIKED